MKNEADLRFLVVEDHELQRRLLLRMLAFLGSPGHLEASDGASALELLRTSSERIDIIITDLDMPGMDGMEFIRHIGESGKRVSVVLASAIDSAVLASVEAMTLAYGVNLLGVIEKPITLKKLRALIGLHHANRSNNPERAPASYALIEISDGLKQQEFEPFFQPKVEFATGEIKGFEALARWRHPRDGWVAPSAFIAQMEASGLIDQLTRAMLSKAAQACRSWRAAGSDFCVSVNLSAASLADPRFADWVVSVAQDETLDPRHVILEVTETAALGDAGAVLENLSRLRMKGFGLSIDDFGTGYSTMQQLGRIAFTELKIDQTFVASASRNAASMVILKSSLDIARKLGLTSVAEGIETPEHWDLLRTLGCELGQGYFIARPMGLAALPGWIRSWQATQHAGEQASVR